LLRQPRCDARAAGCIRVMSGFSRRSCGCSAGLYVAIGRCPNRTMDAATLFMVLTLANGAQSTSTKEFSTLRACEVQADLRQRGGPVYPKPPGSTTEYRCEAHKPIFLLVAYHRLGRSGYRLRLTSLQGCTAYQWIVHMRDRSRTARCYEWARIMDAANRQGEPDFLDMFGQPGQK
jgi:hypothetical protein